MLVVKVELHSARDGRVEELARMIVYNDGKGTRTRGNYVAAVGRKGQSNADILVGKPHKEARVENYPRLNLHVWNLIARALTACGYK